MHLILSTPLSIYLYDLTKARLSTLTTGMGEYSGISWDNSAIYLAHSNIDNASLKTEQDYRNSNKGYVRSYSNNGHFIISNGLSMPHQILSDSLGRLLITNTGHNCILVTEIEKKKQSVCKLNDIDCEVINGIKVGDHFNSLYELNDSLYIVAHNNNRKSVIWELDLSSLKVKKTYDTQAEWAHNIFICEHGMIICDSRNGSLYEIISGETVWKADEPFVITRGLAANDDYIFVGRSEYGNRLSRRWSDGGFWILDRKTLKTLNLVKFKKTGCVNELRLINSKDDCHNAPLIGMEEIKHIISIPPFNNMRKKFGYLNYKFKSMMTKNKK
ncbi:MAG: hypothetical protein A3D21_03720 [Nitrospirae bacterium RIFCSPHIGHO2_02_FULL_42_12]|nr:MAG: hypothetical protein A3D21_03720 [Nitrospirae bacterium RIFCSPHIGHO2_02_FULL_42_12]